MVREWLVDLRSRRLPVTIGEKAANLRRLDDAGFRVPRTLVCTWEAYQDYLADRVELVAELKSELAKKLQPDIFYAVRSSANLEDGKAHTFAGQFKSQLNVNGVGSVMQSIWNIWSMTRSERVQSYLQRAGLKIDDLKMAVLVQEMVTPAVSGVSFSRNPVNGAAEIIVEAIPGSGEALVQEGKTPFRWVWERNGWQSKPSESPLSESLIAEVVKGTQAIAKRFGVPVDLEWVYDGARIFWVQMREITALREIKIYSRRIARDMLPGMIHPLVWSVNTSIVNGAWIDLLTELMGPNDLTPEQLARSFYYRTYFEMGVFGRIFQSFGFPEESLEMMMGVKEGPRKMPAFKMNGKSLRLMPRLIRFLSKKYSFAAQLERALPGFQEELNTFARSDLNQLSESDLLIEVDKLAALIRRVAYYNINTPLLMSLYNQVLRRQLRSGGIDFEQFDVIKGLEEIRQYNPGIYLQRLNRLFLELAEPARQQIATGRSAALAHLENIKAFQAEFYAFMEKFGHLSDSGNDFSVPAWREHPDLILEMVINFKSNDGAKEVAKLGYEELSLPGWKKRMLAGIYRRARQFRLLRERASSLYTYGFGLFRRYFLVLENRLIERGVLKDPGDIFFLNLNEVQELVAGRLEGSVVCALAAQRQNEMKLCREIALPEVIYGDEVKPVHLAASRCLTGIPTSRGMYTGPVTVVQGIRDFGKVEPGVVLVVPFADVGWTPLFAKAGAVISESGGLLSHCSIIAREYGIPAIVSVESATSLPDRAMVTVDGYRGEVIIH